jgi:hypothetical protein
MSERSRVLAQTKRDNLTLQGVKCDTNNPTTFKTVRNLKVMKLDGYLGNDTKQ